jgi:lysophospholipase L1-like esterase
VSREKVRTGPGLKTSVVLVGIFAALTTGALVLFTLGDFQGIVVFLLILIVAFAVASLARPALVRASLALFLLLLVGSIVVGGLGVVQLVSAVSNREGAVDPPDAFALSAAEAKLDVSAVERNFRIELTEDELTAVLQEALGESENPFRRVDVDITNRLGEQGMIDFVGRFKNGDLDVTGSLETHVEAGGLMVGIVEIDAGMFHLPGVARGAVEDMIEDLTDLQDALAEEGAEVQQILIGNDRIIVSGVNRSAGDVDMTTVLSGIRRQVDLADPTVRLAEEFPPGTAASLDVPGDRYYMAVGDSLAASVGVDDVRDGYVSRFHRQLVERDGVAYGLRNFGVSGETSQSLLDGGQLDAAIRFADDHDVRYLTIDVGANDLLGHLGSADCSGDVETPPCLERISGALTTYEDNIEEIFDRLADLEDVTVIVLLAYNPFSFGFEETVRFESQSNQALRRLNDIAGAAALDQGFLVADGFSFMLNTATVTTNMLDNPPDIHPTPLGYDRLTLALVRALS